MNDPVIPSVPRKRGRPKNPSKPVTASSTERVRAFRERRQKDGGAGISMSLTPMAALALEVVRAARVLPSKAAAVERALVTEAQRLAPTPERIRSLIQAGRLEARLAEAWLAAIKKPATKRPGKPKDLRLPRKPPASAGDA